MCFSIEWVIQVAVAIVVVLAIIKLLQLLVSFLLPKMGWAGEIVAFITAAVRIIIWAIVCVAAIYFIGDLIICLLGHLSVPRMRP